VERADDLALADLAADETPGSVGAPVGNCVEAAVGTTEEEVAAACTEGHGSAVGDIVGRAHVHERDLLVLGGHVNWARRGSVQELEYLVLFREAPGLVLREDESLALVDVEDAAGAAHELGIDAGLLLDLGRQTGGPGKVVSSSAVVDGDLHDAPSRRVRPSF
jgi:hypothetical protein